MKRYTIRRAEKPASSEINWTGADCLSDFCFPWDSTVPPRTEFRALWDDERLHFRFDCDDADLVLGEGSDEHERVIGSDRVEIFLAPDLSLRPYFGLEMSPRCEVLDYRGMFYREFDRGWRFPGLQFEGEVNGSHFSVQGSLPLESLRSLGVLKAGASEFFAGVYRAEFSQRADGTVHQGWMPWVNPRTEKPDFHVPESFGVFELADL